MKKTISTILAFLTLLVVLAALGSVVFQLSRARTSGERLAGAEYSVLRNALSPLENQTALSDPVLREHLIALYKGSSRLLAAQILDAQGLVIWKIPADSSYFALPNSTSSRGGFSAPAASSVIFTTPLSGGMHLSALYATLMRSDLFSALTRAILVLGVWLFIAIIAAVVIKTIVPALLTPQNPAQDESFADTFDDTDIETASADAAPEVVPDAAPEMTPEVAPEVMPETVPETMPEAMPERAPLAADRASTEVLPESLKKAPYTEISAAAAAVISASIEEQIPATREDTENTTEETPAAGAVAVESAAQADHVTAPQQGLEMGRELADKLTHELAKKNEDLSLVLVHCDTQGDKDPAIPALASSVKDYFSVHDLIFESGSGAFALVLPSMDLSHAIKMAEDLADVLVSTLNLYHDQDGEAPVFIGLSAKTGRDVSAQRLYKEAQAALTKACTGQPSRILAFRPDPRKYENLLGNNHA